MGRPTHEAPATREYTHEHTHAQTYAQSSPSKYVRLGYISYGTNPSIRPKRAARGEQRKRAQVFAERKFCCVTQKKKERKEGDCGRTYVAGTRRGVTVGLCDLVAGGIV